MGHIITYKAGTEGMKSTNTSAMQDSFKQKAIIYMTLMSTYRLLRREIANIVFLYISSEETTG